MTPGHASNHPARCRVARLAFGALAAAALWLTLAPAAAQEVVSAPGAVLRGLDKVAGSSRDMEVRVGETVELGRLSVTLADCRYPPADPASEAFAWITVRDAAREQVLFDGWMVASSPALHALDHPRFDVWVLTCITS